MNAVTQIDHRRLPELTVLMLRAKRGGTRIIGSVTPWLS
jgi:hypothetical protein